MFTEKIPVLVICGPTASGKTALSVELAKEFNGEIISADSMQIYKMMNIGSAKPYEDEMNGIKHHMIDFLEPGNEFSVADYVKMASGCIDDICSRGMFPILTGGTGLYIDSLINGINFEIIDSDENFRLEMVEIAKEKGNEFLFERLKEADPVLSQKLHPNNVNRVIRALEVFKVTGKPLSYFQAESKKIPSRYLPCYIGLNYENRELLYDKINRRVDLMVEAGLVNEAFMFYNMNLSKTSAQAIGYKELYPYFSGEKSLNECIDMIKQQTRRYAKRQLTWFTKNDKINWIYLDKYNDLQDIVNKSKKIIDFF